MSCTIHPQTIGFNVGDVTVMERVPKEVRQTDSSAAVFDIHTYCCVHLGSKVLDVLTAMAAHIQSEEELWNVLMTKIISEIASGRCVWCVCCVCVCTR